MVIPKVSIVTVNFNGRVALEKTIASVISQSCPDLEYIVIDGGSTDGSVDVIKKYQDKIAYWVSEKDNGVYHAMNKGIAVAKGEYILFLNSGDYLSSSSVLQQVTDNYVFDKDIIYGNLFLEQDGKIITEKHYPDKLTFRYFFLWESLPHPSSFISKKLFEQLGPYNEELKIVADWEFYLKAIFLHQVSYLHIPVAVSVFNLEGLSSKEENKAIVEAEKEVVYSRYFSGIIDDYKAQLAAAHSTPPAIHYKILRKLNLLQAWQRVRNLFQ